MCGRTGEDRNLVFDTLWEMLLVINEQGLLCMYAGKGAFFLSIMLQRRGAKGSRNQAGRSGLWRCCIGGRDETINGTVVAPGLVRQDEIHRICLCG